jgi:hypothetical protein
MFPHLPLLLLQADSTYLHNSRKRLGAAPKSGQPHKYVLLQDMKEMMKLAGGKEHQPVYTKRRVTVGGLGACGSCDEDGDGQQRLLALLHRCSQARTPGDAAALCMR